MRWLICKRELLLITENVLPWHIYMEAVCAPTDSVYVVWKVCVNFLQFSFWYPCVIWSRWTGTTSSFNALFFKYMLNLPLLRWCRTPFSIRLHFTYLPPKREQRRKWSTTKIVKMPNKMPTVYLLGNPICFFLHVLVYQIFTQRSLEWNASDTQW